MLFKQKKKFDPSLYQDTGLLISPIDERDYKINRITDAACSVTFPKSYSLEKFLPPVYDQKNVGSCVAHSIVQHGFMKEKQSEKVSVRFSTEFVYGLRLANQYYGRGMYVREAFSNTLQFGLLPEKYLSGNHEYTVAVPKVIDRLDEFTKYSLKYKNSEYYRVNGISEIKSTLYSLQVPVIITVNVQKCLYEPEEKTGYINIKNTNFKVPSPYGAHAMLIYGWNNRGWLVRNSWGDWYGVNGNIILPFEYPLLEAWTAIDFKSLPDITDIKYHWGQDYINFCYEFGIMSAANGRFNPESIISFERICLMFYRFFLRQKMIGNTEKDYKYEVNQGYFINNLNAQNYYAYDGIASCIQENIIQERDYYNLYKAVTRREAFVMLYNLILNRYDKIIPLHHELSPDQVFKDITTDDSAFMQIQFLFDLGLIKGNPNKTLELDRPIKNVEMAVIFKNLIMTIIKYGN